MIELCFDNEIPQDDNQNANAKLWIQPSGEIYKQYVLYNATTETNTYNLNQIAELEQLYHIPELILPSRIVRENGKILGYMMPFCKGITMNEALESAALDHETLLKAFINLAKAICALPKTVAVGDLHGKNVLVEADGQVHLIDIDGFTVIPQYRQTCPLIHRATKDNFPHSLKYYFVNGGFRVGHQSDIFCFFLLFFRWIMGNYSFLSFTKYEFFDYLKYLSETDFPVEILRMVYRLYSPLRNYIDISGLKKLDVSKIENYNYGRYVERNTHTMSL
jgi:hypothetical protein